ncbi:MAG: outer membrane protein transport protein [Candidatus Hydrogenedentes bacterium]|nr:outer membrane protein transport protein [Candidatus Hydrogenedentota bacterium]
MSCSSKLPIRAVLLAIAMLCAGPRLLAQDLEPSVSPSPVGSGARAAGMANAFVAIADDATAASWNPAGLVQLERPEFSFVQSYNRVVDYFEADARFPEAEDRHSSDALALNYLSYVHPLPFLVLGRNVTVGIAYQQKYDFTRDFQLRYHQSQPVTLSGRLAFFNQQEQLNFVQQGSLSAISPAIAIELTQRLSLGVTVNLWRSSFLSDNDWTQRTRDTVGASLLTAQAFALRNQYESFENFKGENLTLGLLWEINEHWKAGLRYDTAFTGDVKYRRRGFVSRFNNGTLNVEGLLEEERREVHFPDSLALGVAYRHNDRLTVSLDVTRTDWNDFYLKDSRGNRTSLVDASDLGDPRSRTRMDPTYTVRLGAEYVFVPREPRETLNRLWTLRGGVFYDEEPASGRDNGFRVALPDPGLAGIRSFLNSSYNRGSGEPDQFYGAGLGVGLLLSQRVNIDLAYQLRYGPDVNRDFLRGVSGFREDFYQHRFLLSTVVYF